MLLYLARQRQTASSALDCVNGRAELPLTEAGKVTLTVIRAERS